MKVNLHKSYFRFVFALIILLLNNKVIGQTQLAGWTFDSTAAAPSTPSSVSANLGTQSGTAFIYADGTNGSSTWITATSGNELTTLI